MKTQKSFYRKNLLLVLVFLVLISVSLVVALYLAYNLTQKNITSEFVSQKINCLEETIKPYNDFFQNKIPEISFYQGFLDSTSAAKYVDTIFRKYVFVESVIFYDIQISNHHVPGPHLNNLFINLKSELQFKRNISPDSVILFKNGQFIGRSSL